MLEWHDFVEQLLSEESSFDGISLSFDGTAHSVGVPPIIKASVLMLDKMITRQGKFNILVFPERIQSIFIFTLIKLLHNIAEGKIERAYDPETFKSGEKLKLGNAVVEFVGIEDEKNERRMKIKVADLTISAPIEYFPLFQLTNTQRRLSPYEKYVVEKKKIEGLISHLTADEKFLKMLADYRTHMDSSIVSMTSVINAKELLSTCKLCGRDIKSILLVGQANIQAGHLHHAQTELDGQYHNGDDGDKQREDNPLVAGGRGFLHVFVLQLLRIRLIAAQAGARILSYLFCIDDDIDQAGETKDEPGDGAERHAGVDRQLTDLLRDNDGVRVGRADREADQRADGDDAQRGHDIIADGEAQRNHERDEGDRRVYGTGQAAPDEEERVENDQHDHAAFYRPC